MRRRAGCLVLLACIACRPQVPAGTDGASDTFATSSTGTGEATASTTMAAACEALVSKDWCVVGADVELCYGDAWQVELADPVDKLLVGDVDGDGITDILAFNHTPPRIQLFLGVECGSPKALPTIALGEHAGSGSNVRLATTADLDGDGRTDVILAFWDDPGSLVVLAGSAEGLKFRQRADFDGGFTALGVGDVDGDGALDVVYPAIGAPTRAAVHLGAGDGTIGPPQLLQSLPDDALADENYLFPYFTVLDFDEDGLADLNVGVREDGFTGNGEEGQLMFGSGDGHFKETLSYEIPGGYASLCGVGDFDGDGHLDFAALGAVHLGDGEGGFKNTALLDFDHGYEPSLVVGDLDGDGRDDVMLHDRWHLGTPDGLGPALPVPARELRQVGDFNGDGRPDVVESIFDGVEAPNPLVVRFGAPP